MPVVDFEPDVREAIDRAVLCWLSTSTPDGHPSVSPKEIFLAGAGRNVLLANIASPGSARNIKANPRACVAILDIFRQKGWQLYGRAEVISSGQPAFDELAPGLLELAGDAFPFRALFRIEVDEIKEILAPSYRFFPETTEADQIESAMETYGVRPR